MAQGSGGAWTGTLADSPAQTTTYTATCTKGTQTAKATATVTVMFIATPPTGVGTPGGPGSSGGYCAIDRPQFAWDSDATTCTITEQGVGSVEVDASSKAAGGTLNSDGRYYYSPNLPISGSSATYSLQCKGGSQSAAVSIVVRACQKDFAIVPSPVSQNLSPSGTNMIATYTISVNPQDGFTGPVTLSVSSWPSTIPKSRSVSFDTTTLTYSGSSYGTAQMTISIPAADLKQTATYAPVVVQGVSGSLTRTASVSVGSTVKVQPIFKEF